MTLPPTPGTHAYWRGIANYVIRTCAISAEVRGFLQIIHSRETAPKAGKAYCIPPQVKAIRSDRLVFSFPNKNSEILHREPFDIEESENVKKNGGFRVRFRARRG